MLIQFLQNPLKTKALISEKLPPRTKIKVRCFCKFPFVQNILPVEYLLYRKTSKFQNNNNNNNNNNNM